MDSRGVAGCVHGEYISAARPHRSAIADVAPLCGCTGRLGGPQRRERCGNGVHHTEGARSRHGDWQTGYPAHHFDVLVEVEPPDDLGGEGVGGAGQRFAAPFGRKGTGFSLRS